MTTPTIDEVVGQAMDAADTKEPLQVENETDEPNDSTEVTKENAPKTEAEQSEETFSTFNPNDLPPEMQEVYKRWQSDYTKKRQAEKAELKTLQGEVEKLRQGPPASAEINNSYQQGVQAGQIDPSMSLEEYTKRIKEDVTSQIKIEQENSYIESQEQSFMSADPRFEKESPDFDPVLFNYVAGEVSDMRDAYEKDRGTVLGFDFVGNAKKFIEKYDGRIQKLNQAYVARQSKLAKENASKFAKQTPGGKNTSGKVSGKMSLDKAFEAALEQTGTDL